VYYRVPIYIIPARPVVRVAPPAPSCGCGGPAINSYPPGQFIQ
jgi:hypothetical protein